MLNCPHFFFLFRLYCEILFFVANETTFKGSSPKKTIGFLMISRGTEVN